MVWYEIPELGIKFLVKQGIKESLIYKPTKNSSVVFSTKELSKIYNCGLNQSASVPLVLIEKIKGKPDDYEWKDYYMARHPKQFNGFFVIYNGPQSVYATGKENIAK